MASHASGSPLRPGNYMTDVCPSLPWARLPSPVASRLTCSARGNEDGQSKASNTDTNQGRHQHMARCMDATGTHAPLPSPQGSSSGPCHIPCPRSEQWHSPPPVYEGNSHPIPTTNQSRNSEEQAPHSTSTAVCSVTTFQQCSNDKCPRGRHTPSPSALHVM